MLKQLLIKRVGRMKTNSAKKFLLDCIDSHGYLQESIPIIQEQKPIEEEELDLFQSLVRQPVQPVGTEVSSFEQGNVSISDYSRTSRTNQVTGQLMGNYIDFGDDSSPLAKRLAVVQQWVAPSGTTEVRLKMASEQIDQILERFLPQLDPMVHNSIRTLILKVYYNLINYYLVGGQETIKELGANKGDLTANYLAVIVNAVIKYYTGKNFEQTVLLHFIKPGAVNKLYKAKSNLVKIFESEPNYLALVSQEASSDEIINLPPEMVTKAKKIITQLTADNVFGGNIPLAGVLYYLGNKFYSQRILIPSIGKPFTLKYLSELYHLSTTSISSISQRIEGYYSINPHKKRLI